MHVYCAEHRGDIEGAVYEIQKQFPNADVIGERDIGLGIKDYLMTQADKARDPLRQELAESWHSQENPPKVGDILIGEILAVDIGQNTYGPYPIITVADEDDNEQPKAWHGFGTVGINQFNRQRPKAGERIRIECTQVAQSKGTFGDYTAWSLRIQRDLTDDALDRVFGVPENREKKDAATNEEPPF